MMMTAALPQVSKYDCISAKEVMKFEEYQEYQIKISFAFNSPLTVNKVKLL